MQKQRIWREIYASPYFSEERIREMSCADGYQLIYNYKNNGFGAKAVCGNSTLTYNYEFGTKVG